MTEKLGSAQVAAESKKAKAKARTGRRIEVLRLMGKAPMERWIR